MNKYIDKTFRAAAFNFVVYAITSISISISLVHIKNELNFTLTESASFSFISSIEQTLILLFTPIFASRYGKVKILKISLFILILGVLCFSFSINYITALLSLLCMGLGTALQEALLTPIVGDLYPENVNAKMNVMHAFWPLGICGSLIFIGYILSIGISWRAVYLGISLIAFLNFWFYPSSKKIAFNKSNFNMEAAKKIFKSSSFWFFGFTLFFVGGAEGAFSFWSATFIQLNLKTSSFVAGIITACFSLGIMIGRFSTAKLLTKISVPKLIIISAFLTVFVSFTFYFVDSIYKLGIFLFFMGIFLACLWPTIQSYAAVVLPFDATAIMIFLSCFGVPGYSTSSFIMGVIGDRLGLFPAFIIVVPLFLIFPPILFIIACKKAGRRSYITEKPNI
ncbi:MAG: MFS transporter [Treponema sp.]